MIKLLLLHIKYWCNS